MNLQNLVNYCQELGIEDIFSGVVVPDPLDPEDVKSAIMMRCGLLAPVYADPSTFRQMCTFWFKSHEWNIKHLINIILAEYSPIENFDRYEEITINRNGKETLSGSDSFNHGKVETMQHGHNIENQVSAYNTSSYSNSEKELHTGNDINTNSGSDSTAYGKITDNTDEEKTVSHLHGNIGVTTNQQMIEQELELLKSFNIYEWIASRFEDDLFLTVY